MNTYLLLALAGLAILVGGMYLQHLLSRQSTLPKAESAAVESAVDVVSKLLDKSDEAKAVAAAQQRMAAKDVEADKLIAMIQAAKAKT